MKERPILMTPENAQKVFEGTKTQTRRIVKDFSSYENEVLHAGGKHGMTKTICPYGQPGDRLWVRECWADVNTDSGPAFQYRSGYLKFCQDDAFPVEYDRYPGSQFTMWCGDLMRGEPDHKWRSSMHMYRYACRTVVELTEVRVERLHDITEEDAKAEGAAFVCEQCGSDLDTQEGSEVHAACDDLDCNQGSHREGFRRLWNSINGKDSWALNPWVWVLTMRKVVS